MRLLIIIAIGRCFAAHARRPARRAVPLLAAGGHPQWPPCRTTIVAAVVLSVARAAAPTAVRRRQVGGLAAGRPRAIMRARPASSAAQVSW
jgi:hypothetical protein